MKDIKGINESLIKFWDNAQILTDDYKEQVKAAINYSYKDLAPSEKLYQAVASLKNCKSVLDYGCGSGWAAIVANKEGCPNVTAVDLGKNIIDGVKFFSDFFDARINAFCVNPDYLKTVKDNSFDGIVCSNVLDVLPLETSKEIIQELARISVSGSKVVIGLNFYMSKEMADKRNMNLVDGRYLFVNDILRLTSLTDQEWKDLFSPYFEIESLEYFAWPGEEKETRRLFCLIKR